MTCAAQALVLEFHEVFQPEQIDVFKPDRDVLALRKRLLVEEWKELIKELDQAMRDGLSDELRLNVAKEVTDLLYVAYGLAVTLGIDADACLVEVHRSNMTKLFNGEAKRDEQGKVLKGPGYEAPDLTQHAGLPVEALAYELVD